MSQLYYCTESTMYTDRSSKSLQAWTTEHLDKYDKSHTWNYCGKWSTKVAAPLHRFMMCFTFNWYTNTSNLDYILFSLKDYPGVVHWKIFLWYSLFLPNVLFCLPNWQARKFGGCTLWNLCEIIPNVDRAFNLLKLKWMRRYLCHRRLAWLSKTFFYHSVSSGNWLFVGGIP